MADLTWVHVCIIYYSENRKNKNGMHASSMRLTNMQ